MGPVVVIPLLIYQQVTAKPPTWGWFTALVVGGVAWQFQVEYKSLKKQAETDNPKLYLRHVDPTGERLTDMSGFFVQVEGPKKAFGVRIVSPDAAGQNRTRLEMLWGSINEPVGNEPIPVTVLCSRHKGTVSESTRGSQLESYMRSKATEPKELIAIVRFRDVDGNECPARKFRIYRERDLRGDFKAFCELVGD